MDEAGQRRLPRAGLSFEKNRRATVACETLELLQQPTIRRARIREVGLRGVAEAVLVCGEAGAHTRVQRASARAPFRLRNRRGTRYAERCRAAETRRRLHEHAGWCRLYAQPVPTAFRCDWTTSSERSLRPGVGRRRCGALAPTPLYANRTATRLVPPPRQGHPRGNSFSSCAIRSTLLEGGANAHRPSGNANATIASLTPNAPPPSPPALITTYCRPDAPRNVIGVALPDAGN
jgi:hypothetical protein